MGKLILDRIVAWNTPQAAGGDRRTVVTYTYRIVAAHWARKPEIEKVFPMVGRIVKGEGTLQLEQLFRLTKEGWVPASP
ncbi:MAG TPA: hypothetical protein VKD04_14595 [Burkholderiales bacterium]|nr:hypothetical protein [Burkholderiales bacterium]